MKNHMKKFLLGTFMFLSPILAFAQSDIGAQTGQSGSAITVLATIQRLINIIIPILIAAAVVYFIWGVLTYVISKEDGLKEKGRNAMISSVIGLFVILSIWGLVALIGNTFGIGGEAAPDDNTFQNLVPTTPLDCIPGSDGCF